jgi:phage FluMu protein Com
MIWDVYCRFCDQFQQEGARPQHCPRCADVQAIILPHSHEIDERFRAEKEGR